MIICFIFTISFILAKCIDYYTQQRIALADGAETVKPIDPRLEAIVNRMFQRCLDDGQYRQAVGLALETRRMDIFEAAITQADDVSAMLVYAFQVKTAILLRYSSLSLQFQVAMSLIPNRGFRNSVLRSLVGLYRGLAIPDYVNMCQCLIFLEDPLSVAEILDKLAQGQEESQLMAYQIAFDLYESATQQYLGRVLEALRATAPLPALLEDKIKPKKPEITTEQTETTDEKPAPKEERTLDSLVIKKFNIFSFINYIVFRAIARRNTRVVSRNYTVFYLEKFLLSFTYSF